MANPGIGRGWYLIDGVERAWGRCYTFGSAETAAALPEAAFFPVWGYAMFKNLRQYISRLQEMNDLLVVDSDVDPFLEIPEIHRRVIAGEGPALLFTRVRDSEFPVVTNLFGTRRRVLQAFGPEPGRFISELAQLPEELLPPRISRLWQKRNFFIRAAKIGFKDTARAPVTECQLKGADLTKLPALTCWPQDGGPFLTLPLVHTPGPRGGADNLGMYRVQIFEPSEAGLHFQIGKGGGYHLYERERAGEDLPVNIYLGGPPALILSAIAPLPENLPELLLASLIQGEKLGRSGHSVPGLPLISEAEFALIGSAPCGVRRPEGPFGDHYGYYSLQHDYPVFRPKAVYHRKDAIFPATVVGKPKQEDFYLGDYLQELLSPLFPLVMPGVRDLWSYGETGYHSLSAAVLSERYGRESMASAFRILGEGQLSLTKFLLCLDKKLDLRDFRSVLTYVLKRVDWRKDLYIFSELSMDTLDYCGPAVNKGSKGVLLGMGDPVRELSKQWTGPTTGHMIRKAGAYCPGCLVVEVPSWKEDRECVRKIAGIPAFKSWPLIIAVDELQKTMASDSSFLWTTFTRFEPAADIYAANTTVHRHHLMYDGPIVIDARIKTWYPDELFCDEKTANMVERRWKEYFPGRSPVMGDSDTAHL